MLELYHAEPVANSMKVLLCLKEKALEFVSHYVDLLKFEQHEPWFVKINPNGQVPVLVHDGKVITESTVIDEYLEDCFAQPPLRPADPYERAKMRVWTKFIDEYALPALSVIGWHLLVRQVATSIEKDEFEKLMARVPLKEQQDKWRTVAGESFSTAQLEDCRRKLRVSVTRFETALSAGPWLAGSSYSLAEVNAYTLAAALPRMVPDAANEQAAPRLMQWLVRMNERPAVRAALAMPNRVPDRLRTFGPSRSA
ncbi:MAG TPA: glutathione S-transferase family protein [Steroidobacteraceae bacterium]